MQKRVFPLVAVGFLVGMFVVSAQAGASPTERLNFGAQLNPGQCDTTGALVINVVERVTGDIDSGTGGNYWAFDEYNRHIQVWQVGPTAFCAVVKYTGSFTTVQGTSPGSTGTVSAGVTGTNEGGYRALITGTLKGTPGWKAKGNVGSFDYNCDPQTGTCSGYVSWLDKYFDAGYGFEYQWWGWIYRAGTNGDWVNASDGNSGDITGEP